MLSITLVWCERVLIDVAFHWSLVILIFTFLPLFRSIAFALTTTFAPPCHAHCPLPVLRIVCAPSLCAIAAPLAAPARRSTLAPQKIPTFMQ
jgi:hypothetical protein